MLRNYQSIVRFLVLFAFLLRFAAHSYAEGNINYQGGGTPLLMADDMFASTKDKFSNVSSKKEQLEERKGQFKKEHLSLDSAGFTLDAKSLSFDSEENAIHAVGNVLLGYPTGMIEADSAKYLNESKEVTLDGNIKISDLDYIAEANHGWVSLATQEFKIEQGRLYIENGGYHLNALSIAKSSEHEYLLTDAEVTTCECPDNDDICPWKIKTKSLDVTYEGYGAAKDAVLVADGVPVFYLPYLIFPVKTERQTGLLPISLGTSKYSNIKIRQPLFVTLGESADTTIIPFYDASTRAGAELEVRKVFSKNNKLEFGGMYADENMRNGNWQGLSTTGIADPYLKKDRFSYFLKQNFEARVDEVPLQMITDAKYVNDKFIIREGVDSRLAPYNKRFLVSESVVRAAVWDKYQAEVSVEYSEAMVDNSKETFQRVPSVYLSGSEHLGTLGGEKLTADIILNSNLSFVNYTRQEGYDGTRQEIYEKISVPFNYKNVFDAEVSTDLRASQYSLFDKTAPSGWVGDMPSSSTRFVPGFSYKMSTTLERVYSLSEGSLLKKIADLGPLAVSHELVRVKHTIEPFMRYRYVPNIDQSRTPQFDYDDHLAQKNLFTYGISQSLYGKYEEYNENLYGIEEISPEIDDVGQLTIQETVDDRYGVRRGEASRKNGKIRELVRFEVGQSFNAGNAIEQPYGGTIPDSNFSDVETAIVLFPNDHFSLKLKADYDVSESAVRYYTIASRLVDNRGDELRLKFRYLDSEINQIETALQIRLFKNTKLGYYSVYDRHTSSFLEERIALRRYSSCNCWTMDIGFLKRHNPRDTSIMFNIALLGLGDFGKGFSAGNL